MIIDYLIVCPPQRIFIGIYINIHKSANEQWTNPKTNEDPKTS